MILRIDLEWILDIQARKLHDLLEIRDYSALGAAVARHCFDPVNLDHEPDAAWRAAALLHTVVRLEPLTRGNRLFGCVLALAYMQDSGEVVDPPYGALVELAKDVDAKRADIFEIADRLRSWRM
ncbi:toxin Doc [Streptomyces sp. NBC_01465]|uniref:toxin Doc n=1 Tax=Streptomyces sp. NBC_01465 TaxID=2903878 RepID=UPI002E351EF9|nr:toxin Doc [Streptomyces sp. NBC_01465]